MANFTDESARITYERLKENLREFCETTFPNYELTAAGFYEDAWERGEIVIKLHFMPKNGIQRQSPNGPKTQREDHSLTLRRDHGD